MLCLPTILSHSLLHLDLREMARLRNSGFFPFLAHALRRKFSYRNIAVFESVELGRVYQMDRQEYHGKEGRVCIWRPREKEELFAFVQLYNLAWV